ncbi:MAG: T9SS type A sorting domain-containing protein, partial [Bacteroidales bacterium]|nr:T9SS type A sorting domain-containing protein [Bacteroidales bacterium]
ANVTLVTSIGQGANVFKWTVTRGSCSGSDEVIINNNEVFADAGEDQNIMEPNTVLNAEVVIQAIGTWTVVNGTGTFADPLDAQTFVDGLQFGLNTFKWTVYMPSTDCSAEDTVNIVYLDFIPDAGGDQTICVDSANLNAIDVIDANTYWTLIQGSGNFEDASSPTTKVLNLATGENILLWNVNKYNYNAIDTLIITNNQVFAEAGEDQIVCDSFTNLYAVYPIPVGATGEWTIIGGAGTIANQTAYNSYVSGLNFGENTFSWTIINEGCYDNDQVVITSYYNFAKAGQDTIITDSIYQLQASVLQDMTGIWTLQYGNGTFEDYTDPNTIVENMNYGDNLFRWTATYKGCSDFDDVFVARTVSAGEDVIVEGDTVQLNASLPDGAIGEWTVMYGTGFFEDPADPKTLVWDLSPGINIFRWTVTLPESKLIVWDEVTLDKTVNIVDISVNAKIYPNPTDGKTTIYSEQFTINNIEIISISGAKTEFEIIENMQDRLTIDLSGNIPGVYIVKIEGEESTIFKKIVLK